MDQKHVYFEVTPTYTHRNPNQDQQSVALGRYFHNEAMTRPVVDLMEEIYANEPNEYNREVDESVAAVNARKVLKSRLEDIARGSGPNGTAQANIFVESFETGITKRIEPSSELSELDTEYLKIQNCDFDDNIDSYVYIRSQVAQGVVGGLEGYLRE